MLPYFLAQSAESLQYFQNNWFHQHYDMCSPSAPQMSKWPEDIATDMSISLKDYWEINTNALYSILATLIVIWKESVK